LKSLRLASPILNKSMSRRFSRALAGTKQGEPASQLAEGAMKFSRALLLLGKRTQAAS
jgi:hypothetical protein